MAGRPRAGAGRSRLADARRRRARPAAGRRVQPRGLAHRRRRQRRGGPRQTHRADLRQPPPPLPPSRAPPGQRLDRVGVSVASLRQRPAPSNSARSPLSDPLPPPRSRLAFALLAPSRSPSKQVPQIVPADAAPGTASISISTLVGKRPAGPRLVVAPAPRFPERERESRRGKDPPGRSALPRDGLRP